MNRTFTRTRRTSAVVVAGLAALLWAAGPAVGDPTGRISDVESEANGNISLVFSASDLPQDATLDPESVQASIDGVPVPSEATLIGVEAPVDRTAILVIDVSDSMNKEDRIVNAKAAALEFLDAAPADVKVGLVTFNDKATEVIPPTSERDDIREAVAALEAQRGTVIVRRRHPRRRLRWEGREPHALAVERRPRLRQPKARWPTPSTSCHRRASPSTQSRCNADPAETQDLDELASATGGTVVATNQSDELAAVFAASARALDNQLSVVVTVPAELASTSGSVTISALAGSTPITDSAFVPIPGAPQGSDGTTTGASGPIPVESPAIFSRVTDAWLWAGLIALFAGVAIMLGVALVRVSRRRSGSVRGRMSIYTLGGRTLRKESETTSTALGDTQVARSAVDLADRAVKNRDVEELLERRLDAAGLPLKPGEWALVHVGIAVGSGLLLLLLTGGRVLASLIGLLLGVVIPWVYLGVKESRRQAAFYSQLPDTLQLLAGSLSAGYSLPQAVDTVVREGNDPMAAEFNRALVEARLGVPVEEALDNIADRMSSQDFHWVVLAIRVQREVGGNLAEVLTNVAATLRERERLRRQVQVLSAEGRLSAVIIALIPILFALFLVLARPTYLEPLYTTAIGGLMLGFGVLMLVVGIFWLRRVVRVEV